MQAQLRPAGTLW